MSKNHEWGNTREHCTVNFVAHFKKVFNGHMESLREKLIHPCNLYNFKYLAAISSSEPCYMILKFYS